MAEIKIYGKLKNATESGKVTDYSEIDGVPIVEQDLTASGFTPVANTYYKHTGATSATYTQGVIYLYNGTEYKAIDGSGTGGSGVTSVNGKTGDVTITVPTKTSDLTNDSGFVTNTHHDSTKQDTLVSGTNIKTINGNSVLGSGNLEIESGGNPTNGFYPYNAVVSSAPTVGSTYSYDNSKVTYPTDCSYLQGQMIIDTNGVIYKVTGSTMCECVYVPSSGGAAYEVVEITSSQTTLTDDQYATLIASPFNKIKLSNKVYDLYEETTSTLVYTVNYFNYGYRISITKSTKAISKGELNSLISAVTAMQNVSSDQGSTTAKTGKIYVGSGLKLSDGNVLSLAVSSPATVYQHTTTLNCSVCEGSPTESPSAVNAVFSYVSSYGKFEMVEDFWTYVVTGNNWLSTPGAYMYGDIGGETPFRYVEKETYDGTDYLVLKEHNGYGEFTKWYISELSTTAGDFITDAVREI